MKNFIIQNNKNKTEYMFGNTHVFLLEKPNIDFSQVIDRLKKYPTSLFQFVDNIYVGYFDELQMKQVNAAFLDGSIYMIPDHSSVEDALDDIIHETGHSFEEFYKDSIYGDQDIAYEFLSKRRYLQAKLKSEGFNSDSYNFEDVDYDPDLDSFLFTKVGYPKLHTLSVNLFLDPYSVTSLREYFGVCFEHYFLFKNRNKIKELSPMVYKKLESIEEMLYEY